jgi:isopentenyldiphosphate isomerase
MCDTVDYILFLTADVEDVTTPNENEVSTVKYVDQAELKAMFEETSKHHNLSLLRIQS